MSLFPSQAVFTAAFAKTNPNCPCHATGYLGLQVGVEFQRARFSCALLYVWCAYISCERNDGPETLRDNVHRSLYCVANLEKEIARLSLLGDRVRTALGLVSPAPLRIRG